MQESITSVSRSFTPIHQRLCVMAGIPEEFGISDWAEILFLFWDFSHLPLKLGGNSKESPICWYSFAEGFLECRWETAVWKTHRYIAMAEKILHHHTQQCPCTNTYSPEQASNPLQSHDLFGKPLLLVLSEITTVNKEAVNKGRQECWLSEQLS